MDQTQQVWQSPSSLLFWTLDYSGPCGPQGSTPEQYHYWGLEVPGQQVVGVILPLKVPSLARGTRINQVDRIR